MCASWHTWGREKTKTGVSETTTVSEWGRTTGDGKRYRILDPITKTAAGREDCDGNPGGHSEEEKTQERKRLCKTPQRVGGGETKSSDRASVRTLSGRGEKPVVGTGEKRGG